MRLVHLAGGFASKAAVLSAALLSAALVPAAGAGGLSSDIAPSTLSADLDGGRALWVNPALLRGTDDPRFDFQSVWEHTTLRRGLADLSGPGFHLGYRYDSEPAPPLSEIRLAGALGGPAAAFGYALRSQHESVLGRGAGNAADFGFFVRPSPAVSFSWVLRNAGNNTRVDSRNQLIGLSFRPFGPEVTAGAEVRWDEGGYRTNSYRVGARALIADAWELSATYQPPGRGQPREIRLGLGILGPHADLNVSTHPGVEGLRSEHTLGVAVRQRALLQTRTVFGQERTVTIPVSGPLGEEPSGFSLLGGERRSLSGVLGLMRQAEQDPTVRGVLLRLGPLERGLLGPLTAEGDELRDGLFRLRRAGKPVVAYLDGEILGPSEMYVASACDRVVAPRLSTVLGLGVAVEVRRLRGTFQKLGVAWEHAEEGAYKSTFHSYYTDTTDAVQSQELNQLVHVSYEQLVTSLAAGRGLPADSARGLCDGRGLTAAEARDKGLLDAVGWPEVAERELNRMCGRDSAARPAVLRAERPLERRWGVVPSVAVVTAEGDIVYGRDQHDLILGSTTLGSSSLAARLESAARRPGTKALVLRINSGGGSALGADRIREAVEEVRRRRHLPVVVSMGGMAASGGYMIAAPADEIFADSMSVTGSIGVVWSMPTFAGLYQKLDARRDVFKEGEHSDVVLGGRDLTPEERAQLQHLVHDTYEDFLGVVERGRHLSPERAQAAAQGRIWWGSQAVPLGLVDRLGGLRDAEEAAARRAGLPAGYSVVRAAGDSGGLLARWLGGPVTRWLGISSGD